MNRYVLCVVAILFASSGLDCQGNAPAALPAPTALSPGVYSGNVSCPVLIIAPNGSQTTEEITVFTTFEIGGNGIPIVGGEPIRVGRTVRLEGVSVTYTRIAPVPGGIIIHSDVEGVIQNVTASGAAIATLTNASSSEIEYTFSQTWLDSLGFAYNQGCEALLGR